MPVPNYIMTLQNLTADDNEEGAKFVVCVVKDKLKSIKEASVFVVNHSSKDDKKAAATFFDTIYGTPLEIALPRGGTNIFFNVYSPLLPEQSVFGLLTLAFLAAHSSDFCRVLSSSAVSLWTERKMPMMRRIGHRLVGWSYPLQPTQNSWSRPMRATPDLWFTVS
jgi:hypothetical protein